jgi:hypothetical protein
MWLTAIVFATGLNCNNMNYCDKKDIMFRRKNCGTNPKESLHQHHIRTFCACDVVQKKITCRIENF